MHAALFYLPGDRLSQQELSAARLDGHLVEVGEGYMPADTVEDAGARATALTPLLCPGVAVSGPSAAWIHGAGDTPPMRHHVHRATSRRVRANGDRRLVLHDTTVPPEELTSIAGVPVTTARRTLLDLVLGIPRYPDHRLWALALADVAPSTVTEAHDALLLRTRVPGKRAALALLAELSRDRHDQSADQDEVTR